MSTERSDARMVADYTAAIDPLHAACLAARDVTRREFAEIRRRIASWEPAPTPTLQTRYGGR